jgi:hypothetical protein
LAIQVPHVPVSFNSACAFGCTVLSCSCINTNNWYWSGTPYASVANNAWVVTFSDGEVIFSNMTHLFYVWAVRGGS